MIQGADDLIYQLDLSLFRTIGEFASQMGRIKPQSRKRILYFVSDLSGGPTERNYTFRVHGANVLTAVAFRFWPDGSEIFDKNQVAPKLASRWMYGSGGKRRPEASTIAAPQIGISQAGSSIIGQGRPFDEVLVSTAGVGKQVTGRQPDDFFGRLLKQI